MNRELDILIREFKSIKERGYIRSRRSHNTGIGKTFEDYLNVNENNIPDTDFLNFEIKSQRFISKSKVTLFTKKPTHPIKANSYLRENYGTTDEKHKLKVLHTSFYGDRFNTYKNKFAFKLNVNKRAKKVYLLIKDLETDNIIDNDIFYTFEDLIQSTKKLRNLMIVTADTIKKRKYEYFHYTKALIYHSFNFDVFIELIKSGVIQFDIRIGYYKSGKSYGKTHDHGSGFRIKREEFGLLYEEYLEI